MVHVSSFVCPKPFLSLYDFSLDCKQKSKDNSLSRFYFVIQKEHEAVSLFSNVASTPLIPMVILKCFLFFNMYNLYLFTSNINFSNEGNLFILKKYYSLILKISDLSEM